MRRLAICALVLVLAAGALPTAGVALAQVGPPRQESAQVRKVLDAGSAQLGVTRIYDPAYVRIAYPNGDVPRERGICADVVVRAFRGDGLDLQKAVHEDMRAHFAAYPRMWGLRGPDPNIDHRRVANLMAYFQRAGEARPVTANAADYRPADVVAWRLPGGRLHIGLVSDQFSPAGRPLVIHNIGQGAQSEDVLFAWTVIGHYRLLG